MWKFPAMPVPPPTTYNNFHLSSCKYKESMYAYVLNNNVQNNYIQNKKSHTEWHKVQRICTLIWELVSLKIVSFYPCQLLWSSINFMFLQIGHTHYLLSLFLGVLWFCCFGGWHSFYDYIFYQVIAEGNNSDIFTFSDLS